MDSLLQTATSQFCRELSHLEEAITAGMPTSDGVSAARASIARVCLACASAEARGMDTSLCREEFRRSIAPWFMQSWFMHRALTKPRGYPGDYEILEAIYDQKPLAAKGIGHILDICFLQTLLAQAVLHRMQACASLLRTLFRMSEPASPDLRIANIGCGPCRELRQLANLNASTRFSYLGLDFDDSALQHARKGAIDAGIPEVSLSFKKQNVLRLLRAEQNVRAFGRFDLVYSMGLYDYLPDDILQRLVRATLPMVKAHGRYVCAFKDCRRYDKTEYQWFADWSFYQRTEEGCRDLLERAGAKLLAIERDSTGVILFFHIRDARVN